MKKMHEKKFSLDNYQMSSVDNSFSSIQRSGKVCMQMEKKLERSCAARTPGLWGTHDDVTLTRSKEVVTEALTIGKVRLQC